MEDHTYIYLYTSSGSNKYYTKSNCIFLVRNMMYKEIYDRCGEKPYTLIASPCWIQLIPELTYLSRGEYSDAYPRYTLIDLEQYMAEHFELFI